MTTVHELLHIANSIGSIPGC